MSCEVESDLTKPYKLSTKLSNLNTSLNELKGKRQEKIH